MTDMAPLMGAFLNGRAEGEDMGRRFTEEEMEQLRKNPAVKLVSALTIVLKQSYYSMMLEHWKKHGGVEGIRKDLAEYKLLEILEDTEYIEVLEWGFKKEQYNCFENSADNVINVALVASGLFVHRASSIAWVPEVKKFLLEKYPEQTFEEGIIQIGLTPEIVGSQRICALRQTAKQGQKRKTVAEDAAKRGYQTTTPEDQTKRDAYIYVFNPYVREVAGKSRLWMTGSFFNEMKALQKLPIDRILEIYEIDASLISQRTKNNIQQELLEWRRTKERQNEVSDQMIRIQTRRLNTLCDYSDALFDDISKKAVVTTPLQKKQLCGQISEYPTSLEYPYGYSMREILGKIGISKTTYYKALNCKGYGMGEELRHERDRRDLVLLMKVVEYKGFEKGIRQIYMMMPDITGEQFAISKIRRLLRSAGVKTKVRSENPNRQRTRKFHERNTKPNLLERKFRLHRPNEVRLTDVTYLDYGRDEDGGKKRAYGSSCIDPVTGKVLAFNVSESNDVELAVETLETLSDYPAVVGALLHSDQGILYLTEEFQQKVREMGMAQSMSKRGNCWDNSPQESFFGHFKDECPYEECDTFEELRSKIDEYAHYYNNERHQWDRKKMTPLEYEKYMNGMTDEEFAAYIETEQAKYVNMKKRAEKLAKERAKTLGV